MHLSSQVCQCQYHHRNSSVFDFARWLLNLVRDSLDLESVREFARFYTKQSSDVGGFNSIAYSFLVVVLKPFVDETLEVFDA